MTIRFSVFVFATFLVLSTVAGVFSIASFGVPPAMAQASDSTESSAFEQAKELGTVDAWNAFIKAFPTGFHADLARAYLKKLGDQPAAAARQAAQTVPALVRAEERLCSERRNLRSIRSTEPTKITFINVSGSDRLVKWIDYSGNLRDNGRLSPGDQVTIDTYRTHPFLIETAAGDCLEIFLPAAKHAIVQLGAQGQAQAGQQQGAAAHVVQTVPASGPRAAERKCSERRNLRSRNSTEAAKITFINSTGSDRLLKWIDFKGKVQDYGRLNAGDQVTLDTYRTHPWLITSGAGDCRQIFLPAAGHATVDLTR